MLRKLRNTAQASAALDVYRAMVARAREPVFYRELVVRDSIDGRFDLLTLHAFLVFDALKGQGPAADEMGAKLADMIFTGFDEALRELGISDFGMSRRIRNLADAFYGRMHHYGLAQNGPELADAVQRNLYRGHKERGREAAAMATYMMKARDALKRDVPALLAGKPDFGPMPGRVERS